MSLAVKFNGVDITKYITVLDGFTVHSGTNWDPSCANVSGKSGESFTHTRYKAREIPMPFAIKGEINTK